MTVEELEQYGLPLTLDGVTPRKLEKEMLPPGKLVRTAEPIAAPSTVQTPPAVSGRG
jgi:hypothetical protein